MPVATHACGTTSEKSCCKTEKSEKKDCCKSKDSKEKENKGCNGKCGHTNCTSTSAHSIVAVFNYVEITSPLAHFSAEKQNFYDSKTFISSGFSSVWLIPKIG